MNKKAHGITSVLIAIAVTLSIVTSSLAINTAPSREINVVYDDSGSMIQTRGQLVDTWCQAKYAMEVFAAMLGENDTMNVYYMSDFEYGLTSGPKLVLHGSDSQQINVGKIHDTISKAGNTPFNTVKKAYKDLQSSTANEKWLVVLTDGEFEDGNQSQQVTDDFFAAKQQDIQVMFLAMGKDAGGITENKPNHIFFEKAETNNQILSKITDICTRIFNSDRLDVNVSSKTVEFDVPMGELVVFAQGANVSINGIKDSSGKVFLSSSTPVSVKYSEKAATNYTDNLVSRNLMGSIASFKDDFPAGKYAIDVSGADTVEVYYKPNVEIAAFLMDSSGSEVTSMKNLKRGEYTIHFGLVKAGTDEAVGESSLLGTVVYSATVKNNGKTHASAYTSGDRIVIEEGLLEIDAFAHFLEYNTVSTHLNYNVYDDKTVGFEVKENPEYLISNKGAHFEYPIILEMQVDGGISEEQWKAMEIPIVSFDEKDSGVDGFKVEKGPEPGTFLLYPTLDGSPKSEHEYHDFNIDVNFDGMVGDAAWRGQAKAQVRIKDNRTRISGLQIVSTPEYTVNKTGLVADEPVIVRALTIGDPIDNALWDQMTILETEVFDTDNGAMYGPFEVEKGNIPGEYHLYPRLKSGMMSHKEYGDFRFATRYPGGNGTPAGEQGVEGTIRVRDVRSWLERHIQLIIRIAIIAAIALFILGYVPPFKKYLPRRLKSRPKIVAIPNKHGVIVNDSRGRCEKSVASTLIPYRAQRGTIRFAPPGAGAPPLRVRAAGGNGMEVLNTKDYAGKTNITFTGMSVPENPKKLQRISAGSMLSVSTHDATYTCVPNQQ